MATRPLRPCSAPGCPALVGRGRCSAHARQVDRQRGTPAERGYGGRWRRVSLAFLARNPLCGMRDAGTPETQDSLCLAEGWATAATLTDHIVPATGPDDSRFFDESNYQALCEACHNAKRQREAMGGQVQGRRA